MCYSGRRKMIPERNRNSGNNKDHRKEILEQKHVDGPSRKDPVQKDIDDMVNRQYGECL